MIPISWIFGGLSTLLCTVIIFIIFVFMKTTAWSQIKAAKGKKLLIINPTETKKIITYVVDKSDDKHASYYCPGKGYFLIDSDDVFIDPKTKCSVAICYGGMGHNVSPKFLLAKKYLDSYFRDLPKEELEKARESLKEGKDIDIKIPIVGESIPLTGIRNYFTSNISSADMESTIQRLAANEGQRNKKDIFMWAVILIGIIVGGAVAYSIVSSATGGAAAATQVTTTLSPDAVQAITNAVSSGMNTPGATIS